MRDSGDGDPSTVVSDLLVVLALALLPPAGNFAGGVVAEVIPVREAWLNRALHAAAGVVIAVVAVEIMPQALDVVAASIIAAAFFAGGLAYIAVDRFVEHRLDDPGGGSQRMWMIYVAVAADLFGDGLMIGAGASVSVGLGLVLALGQVLADIPEGFAAIFTFKANDLPRRRRMALSASFFVPTVVAAVAAYFLLRGRPEAVQFTALAATAGLFAVAAFEDMIAEAHETADDSHTSTITLISGFCLFVLVSAGLG